MINLVEVVRIRYFVRAGLRLVGLLMIVMAINPTVSWFIEGFVDEDLFDVYYYGDRIASIILLSLVGFLLLFLNKSIASLLVPLPSNECPRCGYSLRRLESDSCPECGLFLERTIPSSTDIDSAKLSDEDVSSE